MREFDCLIRGGTVANAADTFSCDIGIRNGHIAALGQDLGEAREVIDAAGKLVLPGGIDSHVHLAQPSGPGIVMADDFESGTRSAALGGNTTVLPFCLQEKGQSLRAAVTAYRAKAEGQCHVDVSFHLIIADPTEQVLGQELPALIEDGYTSFKVFMTYEGLALSDREMLEVMAVARETGAIVMVHAENYDAIRFLTDRLERLGHTEPHFHAPSRPIVVEREATHRAIALAELVDVPVMIVHVSNREAMEEIRRAQAKGLRVQGETCPQYLVLTARDLEGLNMEGAKYVCSPPPRDTASQEACWEGLAQGVFSVFSSDHCPFRYDDPWEASAARAHELPVDSERYPGHRNPPTNPFFGRRRERAHRPQPFRGAHGDKSRQDIWPLPPQRHDCGRGRRRHRDLGPDVSNHYQARSSR